MTKPTPAERDRIRAALEAHARGSKDLTISAYARAAGVTRETARNWIAKMGLPVKKDPTLSDPIVPPPGAAEKGATTPDATKAPAAPTGGANDDRALLDRLMSELHTLPPAVGQEVRLVLSEIVALKGENADAKAVAAARQKVAQLHSDSVVAVAAQIQTDDEEAGEVMRRYWLEHGLSGEFRSPGELVKSALSFWWKNRDEVRHLRDDIEALAAECESLRLAHADDTRVAQARDQVMLLALAATLAGHPLPSETVMGYLRVLREETLTAG